MALSGEQLARTTARCGAARSGATRSGFCPSDVESENDPAASGPLYAWRDVFDVTSPSDWTEVS